MNYNLKSVSMKSNAVMQGQDKPGQVSERHTIKRRLICYLNSYHLFAPFSTLSCIHFLNLIFILRCTCDDGWTGKHCSDLYIPCHPSPCQNGGQCESIGAYGYQCHCPSGEQDIMRRSDYLQHPSLDPSAFDTNVGVSTPHRVPSVGLPMPVIAFSTFPHARLCPLSSFGC